MTEGPRDDDGGSYTVRAWTARGTALQRNTKAATRNTFSVLDHCNTFFVNPFSDRHNYLLFGR